MARSGFPRRNLAWGGLLIALFILSTPACARYVEGTATQPAATQPPTVTPTAFVRLITATPRATATAIPVTPLPTATATATPTPVIHVIQKGDTLLGLAEQYDVSVQALIEANNILNPRALSIGQEIIIPYNSANILEKQPTATPTPMPLRVVNMAFYQTPTGSLWCLGEVKNERDQDLELVQLQVSLYNAQGDALHVAAAFVAAEYVPEHGVAPFSVLLPNVALQSFASYQVVVLSAEPLTHWGRRYRDLTVRNVSGGMHGNLFVVQGSVQNTGEATAQEITLVFTLYDQHGLVVGVRRKHLETTLSPDAASTFAFSLIPIAPAAGVRVSVWGARP